MDGIIIFSRNTTEHETHLKIFFEIVREFNFNIAREKSGFFKIEITFLGYILSA